MMIEHFPFWENVTDLSTNYIEERWVDISNWRKSRALKHFEVIISERKNRKYNYEINS